MNPRGGAGDTDPFLAFYRSNVEPLYRWVHRRCRDHALAEDIVQDTFLAAADHPESVGSAWLYTVARNRLIDVIRRAGRFDDRLHLVGPTRPPAPPNMSSSPASSWRVRSSSCAPSTASSCS